MLNYNPIEMAKQQSNSGNYTKSAYFKVGDGETKIIRLLTGFSKTYIVGHKCGVQNLDFDKEEFDRAMQLGQPIACPVCGEPLTAQDIIGERPMIEGAYIHGFVQTSDPQKKANFVCLSHKGNIAGEFIENIGGEPKYDCPVCHMVDTKGKELRPSLKLYGIAVERKPIYDTKTVNGIPVKQIVGTEDIMVADDDGNMHPSVVVVNLPYKSFWSVLYDFQQRSGLLPVYFDWEISRVGSGLETVYTVRPLRQDEPEPISLEPYRELLPDIRGMLCGMGKPEYYTKNGIAVQGYVPESDPSPAPVMAQNNAAAMVNAIPQQQHQQPSVGVGWAQVSANLQR